MYKPNQTRQDSHWLDADVLSLVWFPFKLSHLVYHELLSSWQWIKCIRAELTVVFWWNVWGRCQRLKGLSSRRCHKSSNQCTCVVSNYLLKSCSNSTEPTGSTKLPIWILTRAPITRTQTEYHTFYMRGFSYLYEELWNIGGPKEGKWWIYSDSHAQTIQHWDTQCRLSIKSKQDQHVLGTSQVVSRSPCICLCSVKKGILFAGWCGLAWPRRSERSKSLARLRHAFTQLPTGAANQFKPTNKSPDQRFAVVF